MFEEICLVCGKHLLDDGRAYCSDDCQILDAVSPSISSASSAWSSPNIECTTGGDVPPLVPSALGSVLNDRRGRDRYSISSSSASSVSWSAVTDDDEEDNAVVGAEDENGYQPDGSDAHSSIYESGSKSPAYPNGHKLSALSYARRPSTTNTRSTIPLLHRRTSSGSGSTHAYGAPQSAPADHSSAEDDDDSSAVGSSTQEHRSVSYREKPTSTITAKSKRSRNRASLPAYFSLLQLSSPSQKMSPLSSSSGKSVARSSPSTPKLALSSGPTSGLAEPSLTASVIYAGGIEATPRGRRREPGTSRGSRRSQLSRSRSRSRNVSRPPNHLKLETRERLNSRSSVEQVFDWSSHPVPRGRPAVRRNSSPLPKMLLPSTTGLDERGASSGLDRRGRMTAEELDSAAVQNAPGYGSGRSGLRDRERDTVGRVC